MNANQTHDMLGRSAVLSLETARDLLRQHLPEPSPGEELLPLADVLGRVTASPLTASEDLPPHPRSTMDGYAVHAGDTYGATEALPAYLEVTGEVLMGTFPAAGPPRQTCYRIATGGLLPPGTDAVVMLEHTVAVDDRMIEVVRAVAPGTNVIAAGDDVRNGETVVPAGHVMRAQDLGIVAGLGIVRIPVRRQVKVGIISTGDEIVAPGEQPPPGRFRDVNGTTLAGLVASLGALPTFYGIVPDSREALSSTVETALAREDMVLLSGSSSVGARDHGEQVLGGFGPPGVFIHGVGIKPGKPVIVAGGRGKLLFGLPGHPVSAAVCFDLLVRPALRHMAGRRESLLPERRSVPALMGRNLNSAAGRVDYVRIRLETGPDGRGLVAHPVLGRSGALSTMVHADGFILVPEPSQGLLTGEPVEVALFD